MRKIFSLILSVTVVLSSIPVFAASEYTDVDKNSRYYYAISFFENLGLIDGLYGSEFMPDVAMTRADFAIMFARLTGFNGSGSAQRFSDVAADSPAFAYINYMYEKGYILGDGDGCFRPNDGISVAEGVKIVLTALGYERTAVMRGGYPSGYISVASDLGLLKGVNASGTAALTRGEMCVLMYNAMDTPMLTVDNINDDGTYTLAENEDSTILSKMLGLEKSKGVFLANDKFSVYGGVTGDKGVVVINYTTYSCELDTDTLVGKYVDYYVDADGKVVAVFDISEDVKRIEYDDILPASTAENIQYEDEVRQRTIKLGDNTFYCYNGTPAKVVNDELVKPSYGELNVIDYEGDNVYDCVMVWDYKIEIIKGVSEALGTAQAESGKMFKEDDEAVIYKNGELAEFSSIKQNDVALVAENETTIIYLSDNCVKGTVSAVDYNEYIITADGVEYEMAPISAEALKLGAVHNLYLDKYGRVAYIKNENGRAYAYVQNIYVDEDTLKAHIKMFNHKAEFETAVIAEKVNLFEGSTLKARIESEDLRGYFLKGDEFEKQLIEYEKNLNGEVAGIYVPEYAAIDDYSKDGFVCNLDSAKLKEDGVISSEKSYYYTQYFYIEEKRAELSFLTSASTPVFYLPEKEKNWSVITPGMLASGQELPGLKAYNFTEDGLAGAVVIQATELIDTTFTLSDKMFVIDRISVEINEDDEICKVISGIAQDNKRVSFKTSIDDEIECGTTQTMYPGAKLDELKEGDIVTVIANNDNEITDFNILYKYGDEAEYAYSPYPDSLASGSYLLMQREKSCMAYRGPIIGRGSSAIMIKNGLMSKARSYLHSKAQVVIYDTEKKEAYSGTVNDICAGQDAFVHAYPAYGVLYIVIYN